MRLLLSSEASPVGTPANLARACRRRSLAGLELAAAEVRGVLDLYEVEVPVLWLRATEGLPSPFAIDAARRLGAGLLLGATMDLDPPATIPTDIPCAVVHGTDVAEAARAVVWATEHDASTAWEVDPTGLATEQIEAVLAQTRPTLAHVRLLGAGPETGDDEGTAVLMVRLALSGYAGTVTLAPSADADLTAWSRWLFDTRSWGCGTAHERRVRAHTTPNV